MSKKLFILLCQLNFIVASAPKPGPESACEQTARKLTFARSKEAYADLPEDEIVVPVGPFGYEYWTSMGRFTPEQLKKYREEVLEERLNCTNKLFGARWLRYNGARHLDPFWVKDNRFESVKGLLGHPSLTDIKANLIERAEKESRLYQQYLQNPTEKSGLELDALNSARRKELETEIDFRGRRKERNEEKKQKLDEEKKLKAKALDCVMKQKEKKEQELQEEKNRLLKAAKQAIEIGEALVRRKKIAVALGVGPVVTGAPVFGGPLGRGVKRGLE